VVVCICRMVVGGACCGSWEGKVRMRGTGLGDQSGARVEMVRWLFIMSGRFLCWDWV
jgi:hypothetical protein